MELKTSNEEIPRGLRLRRKTWTISRSFNGVQVRQSTGCSDLGNALKVYREVERKHQSPTLDGWWAAEILKGRESGGWLRGILARAKRRGLACTLSLQEVIALAEVSGGRCTVSGIKFSDRLVNGRRPFLASLNRIDCKVGYTFANCRFVCILVNFAMSDFGEDAFRIVARHMVAAELTDQHLKFV